MRLVTAHLFSSIDGVVSAPHEFQGDAFDDDLGAMMGEAIARQDAIVLGRVTYQEWAAYWPTASRDGEFAEFINGTPKHVASTTLAPELEWENSSLIEGDLVGFVEGLKQQDGGDIAVQGSISVVRRLLVAGVLDRLTLTVHPVFAGRGTRLFGDEGPLTRVSLLESRTTAKGNVVSVYGPR
ncbi:deaminase reductase [Cnuibacter physcomitrellae]|uniref:Deaminase n=1 Tax=Cnuibacter physcomitrellae TaxID=1619308 RepID=A0A1X9LQS9_9MICO|nr:dihydrofolate reductase family protein [Cnuibacter physcomitrellae]ARJ06291.1 deaminase [Cnuibacter physcomitrellae]GGI37668.1 deaminase reductase [Cnuibacter physcomitrellae]